MIVALWILLALVLTGVVLYIHHRITDKGDETAAQQPENRPEGCCGQHLVCEKESLLAGVSKEIVYYEDEELDTYAGRSADQYSDDEADAFRDVLYTMRSDEVAGWVRSLQLRGVELPDELKDEVFLIVGERRGL